MTKDVLDKTTEVSAELTEKGITAKSNSRAVNGLDRLVGNLFDWANVGIESKTLIARETTEGRKRVVKAAADYAVKRIAVDGEFAERALENTFAKSAKAQANKDGVAKAALEDLTRAPPSEKEATTGPETIDEPTMDRIEHYAEFASTNELRERWGRVLAQEVRKPGTFSAKDLRVVDEMGATSAKMFEGLCQFRIGACVPKTLIGDVSFEVHTTLSTEGLILDVGNGQVWHAQKQIDALQREQWFFMSTDYDVAMSFPVEFSVGSNEIIHMERDKPTLKVYVLTEVGRHISSILTNNGFSVMSQLAQKAANQIGIPVALWIGANDGTRQLRQVGQAAPEKDSAAL